MNSQSSQLNRTLLDVIRDEGKGVGHKDKKSWKSFRDKLRLRKAGSAWTSSVPTPTSDIPIRPQFSRNTSARISVPGEVPTPRDEYAMIHDANGNYHKGEDDGSDSSNDDNGDDGDKTDDAAMQATTTANKPMMSRRISSRFDTSSVPDEPGAEGEPSPVNASGLLPQSLRPQFSRHNSTRMAAGRSFNRCASSMIRREESSSEDQDEPVQRRMTVTFLDDRQTMSAREAAAAQEAADAKREGHEEGSDEEEEEDKEGAGGGQGQPLRMSLMDLLAETDREMGLEGARYTVGEDEDEEDDEEMVEEEDEQVEEGNQELSCSVCHVKHKGAASVPCGHTYCRLCSKELYVSRDHCPLCNDYMEEILDVF